MAVGANRFADCQWHFLSMTSPPSFHTELTWIYIEVLPKKMGIRAKLYSIYRDDIFRNLVILKYDSGSNVTEPSYLQMKPVFTCQWQIIKQHKLDYKL